NDLTTSYLLDPTTSGLASFISKHPSPVIVCGLPCLQYLLQRFDKAANVVLSAQDGNWLHPGEVLCQVRAKACSLLKIERLALNILRHLSAIATLTSHYEQAIKHTKMQILDTRKTTPGLRHLEKYAVTCGGGINHRQGLYDAIMVKDTHIDLLGDMQTVLARLPL